MAFVLKFYLQSTDALAMLAAREGGSESAEDKTDLDMVMRYFSSALIRL